MRHRRYLVLGFVLAIGLLAGASIAAAEGPTPGSEEPPAGTAEPFVACGSGHVCVWPSPFYVGTVGESLCTGGAHGLAATKTSGKDACANKAVWYRQNGTALACGNPNQETPNFGFAINELWIGAEGSRC